MKKERILALGFFDGVHLGHGALLRRVKERSLETGLPACALSFDVHPAGLVLGRSPALLTTAESRARLMRELYGMDEVLIAHFDEAMMRMPWETFAEDYLAQRLGAAHVVCGTDFRFGFGGKGTAELLQKKCAALRVGCDVLEKVSLDGQIVSSTKIRALLEAGDALQAARFLGHAYSLPCRTLSRDGGCVRLMPQEGLLLPAQGLYRGSIGGRPCRLLVEKGFLTAPDAADAPPETEAVFLEKEEEP